MTQRRAWANAAAAGLIGVLAAGGLYLEGGSTPVAVESVLERYREAERQTAEVLASPTPAAPADRDARGFTASRPPRVPATTAARAPMGTPARAAAYPLTKAGVYVYATSGREEVDVLGGSSHTYPERTTITVRHTDCGTVQRWDVLRERWSERESCWSAAGEALVRMTTYHEFFRYADERTYRCDPDTLARPARVAVGAKWSGRCVSGESVVELRWAAPRMERLEVGGVPVDTLLVHTDVTLTGEQQGSGRVDVWGVPDTGLIVRERSELSSRSTQPVFGETRYTESYEIRLTSLDPQT